jgi:HSP90 family molecular chaperone
MSEKENKVKAAFNRIQKAFDDEATKFSPEEYKEFCERVSGHVESCLDCIKDEQEED